MEQVKNAKQMKTLLQEVESSRQQYIAAVSGLTAVQANFKPAPDGWSIVEITEHIVLAEQVGVIGMWRALKGFQAGKPIWEGEPVHRGLPIETVIEKTWQVKENVPDVASPRWGGPLEFWTATLRSCSGPLQTMAEEMADLNLESIIYPHPISGPLDVRQRLEFLRFHLDRHRAQVMRNLAAC